MTAKTEVKQQQKTFIKLDSYLTKQGLKNIHPSKELGYTLFLK